MTRTPPTMPNCPEDWEKLYKKLARDLALVEEEWDIDMHDLVELKLNKKDHTVEIVDKKPHAVAYALARVGAIAIAPLFHKHGGMVVSAGMDGIHLELDCSETCKRVVSWEEALGIEDGGVRNPAGGYYLMLADRLEELAAQCRERIPHAKAAYDKAINKS